MNQTWLPLTEYSSKYRVSLSTLRRRIKAEDIQFRFADGKYFIIDAPLVASQRPSLGMASHLASREENRPSQSVVFPRESQDARRLDFIEDRKPPVHESSSPKKSDSRDEPILAAANRLLTELKKAYSHILHEKEEQILHLKEEVSDLKTLVRVLESENSRLQK